MEHDWLIETIEDLRKYSEKNNLPNAEATLSMTIEAVIDEIDNHSVLKNNNEPHGWIVDAIRNLMDYSEQHALRGTYHSLSKVLMEAVGEVSMETNIIYFPEITPSRRVVSYE